VVNTKVTQRKWRLEKTSNWHNISNR